MVMVPQKYPKALTPIIEAPTFFGCFGFRSLGYRDLPSPLCAMRWSKAAWVAALVAGGSAAAVILTPGMLALNPEP